jgi:hypothetical protein
VYFGRERTAHRAVVRHVSLDATLPRVPGLNFFLFHRRFFSY